MIILFSGTIVFYGVALWEWDAMLLVVGVILNVMYLLVRFLEPKLQDWW
jgi:uncharacterized membrane-anchored protein YhcB (DUF1043 family)